MAAVFHVLDIPQDIYSRDTSGRPNATSTTGRQIAELTQEVCRFRDERHSRRGAAVPLPHNPNPSARRREPSSMNLQPSTPEASRAIDVLSVS
jgi:hypothetical protein